VVKKSGGREPGFDRESEEVDQIIENGMRSPLNSADGEKVQTLAGYGKTRILNQSRNPYYAELEMTASEMLRQNVKCLDLLSLLPALAACGHTSPLTHAAPSGLASNFRMRTRL
jgi:hypothetical protein